MNNKKINKAVFRLLTGLLISVILFHLCIIAKIIPYDIAWGGRLENDMQMYIFEGISILIIVILIAVLLLKNKSIDHRIPDKYVDIPLWIFLFLFLLNTIGNLFAKTSFEKWFAVLTFLLAILLWIILKRNKKKGNNTFKD